MTKAKLCEWLTLVEAWLPSIIDDAWMEQARTLAEAFEWTPLETLLVDRILEGYAMDAEAQDAPPSDPVDPVEAHPSDPVKDIHRELDALLSRKQTEQRTEAWYRQMAEVLTASELGQLFGSPYARGKLVLSKTQPYQPRNQLLATYSDQMSSFDWGIRFEPVVKQIYEEKHGATVKELGRLAHPTDPRCMASPDGLVYDARDPARVGRLVEIKCPVTREITGVIPKDYYTQMQLQLHVTGRPACDYVEAEFASPYAALPAKHGPSEYSGVILLVYVPPSDATEGRIEYRYSPVNAAWSWEPEADADEAEILERIPWQLMTWSEQVVERSERWWRELQPLLDAFWTDVEHAKRGQWQAPASSRPTKKAKLQEPACQIQFHRLDENGMPLLPRLPLPITAPEAHKSPEPSLDGPSSMNPDTLDASCSSVGDTTPLC